MDERMRAQIGRGDTMVPQHPGQAAFDDPSLDARFPAHPLSQARAAWRWCRDNVRVSVVMPPPYRPVDAEVALPAAGLALVPPPRFVIPGWAATGPKVILNRASFAGSEGIDLLIVQSLGAGHADLGREVEGFARQEYVEAGVKNIRAVIMDDVDLAGPGARPSARVLMEGDGHLARLRMVVRGDQLEDGTLAIVAMSTTATMVVDEQAAEVDAAARTLRSVDGLEDG
jgi:hypothetical protein